MINLNNNQQKILQTFLEKGSLSSSSVHSLLTAHNSDVSLVTIKRELTALKSLGFLAISGAGRSIEYTISSKGRLFTDIDAHIYTALDPDKRHGLRSYNFDLINSIPSDLFSNAENLTLNDATRIYRSRTKDLPSAIEEKELERFIIELSWKSSKIEGNTYTLLDTEKLILRGTEAPGHDKSEAMMILNHKEAFKFIRSNLGMFQTLSRSNLEEIHKILVKGLNINHGLRSKAVGVTGSIYRPLDNQHQIAEAIEALERTISSINDPIEKALIGLLGTSYIQPFEDGNKRTSRLIANAILLAHGRAPLSYRSVEENSYREAILVFYELNSLIPFKNIFIEQYRFAAENYSVT